MKNYVVNEPNTTVHLNKLKLSGKYIKKKNILKFIPKFIHVTSRETLMSRLHRYDEIFNLKE